jgi:hypothetical protein
MEPGRSARAGAAMEWGRREKDYLSGMHAFV